MLYRKDSVFHCALKCIGIIRKYDLVMGENDLVKLICLKLFQVVFHLI